MKKNKNIRKWILLAGVAVVVAAGFLYAYFHGQNVEITVTKPEDTPTPTAFIEEDEEPTPTEIPSIFVYVCGAVKTPGLYEMPYGTRGLTAVEMAGGFDTEADIDYLNLATILSDGERLYIPYLSDTKDLSPEDKIGGTDTGGTVSEAVNKVNINTAGIEELMTLSGIGESRAQDIIDYRTKVGAFLTIEEIMNVSGIGESRFAKIKDSIRVN